MDKIVVLRAESLTPIHGAVIKHNLESALMHSRGEIAADYLMFQAQQGKVQLWGVYEMGDMGHSSTLIALASTEVVIYGEFKALRVITLSGKRMSEWKEKLDAALTKFAVSVGCRRMEAVGRPGFEKTLAPLGFEKAYTIYVKEVVHEQDSGNNSNDINNRAA